MMVLPTFVILSGFIVTYIFFVFSTFLKLFYEVSKFVSCFKLDLLTYDNKTLLKSMSFVLVENHPEH